MNVLGNNCNDVTSAESVLMLKERIVDRYGEIRYTMANGCSGGSIGQHMIEQRVPRPRAGHPAELQLRGQHDDRQRGRGLPPPLRLLHDDVAAAVGRRRSRPAVAGEETFAPCALWEALFASVDDPQGGCGLPADQDYDPATNPTGCRGDVRDFQVSIYGKRPSSIWTAPEKIAGRLREVGRTTTSASSTGSSALRSGRDHAGAVRRPEREDRRPEHRPQLRRPRAAWPIRARSKTAYRSGARQRRPQLDKVAIIDLRGTSNESDIHTDFHTYAMRARLDKANGGHGNQIIWTFAPAVPIAPTRPPGDRRRSRSCCSTAG